MELLQPYAKPAIYILKWHGLLTGFHLTVVEQATLSPRSCPDNYFEFEFVSYLRARSNTRSTIPTRLPTIQLMVMVVIRPSPECFPSPPRSSFTAISRPDTGIPSWLSSARRSDAVSPLARAPACCHSSSCRWLMPPRRRCRRGAATTRGRGVVRGSASAIQHITSLQWRHNERDGVSNHQSHGCLFNRLFKAQIKGSIKAPRYWSLWGEFTGDRWIPRTKGQ